VVGIVPEGDTRVAAGGADTDIVTERPDDQPEATEVSVAQRALALTLY